MSLPDDPGKLTLRDDAAGCLLCRCEEIIKDKALMPLVFMSVGEMAAHSGSNWAEYVNACRTHAMLHVRAGCAFGEMAMAMMKETTPAGLESVTEQMARETRRILAKLEVAVMEKYERREREKEAAK